MTTTDREPEQAKRPPRRWRITRRRLLIGLGSGAGLLAIGAPIAVTVGRPKMVEYVEETGVGPTEVPLTPSVWFELTGTAITVFVPKVEMGQGIHTALAQLAAEELEVLPEQLTVRQADSGRGFGEAQFTFGSSSVTGMFTPIRQVAASVREMLRTEAARQLAVAPDQLRATDGTFVVAGSTRTLTYLQVIEAKAGEWVVPAEPPALKEPGEFRRIGSAMPRVDMRDKVMGRAVYGYDARVDGMRFGAVARPPRFGDTLARGTEGRARDQAGVLGVVIDVGAGFAGVVADTRTRAHAALAALDLTWEGGTDAGPGEIDALLEPDSGAVLRRKGSVQDALGGGILVEAEYRTPLVAHAHLEPLAALARVEPGENGRIEAWVPTQSPAVEISALQKALGDERDVLIHPTQLGGSFGRKAGQSAVVEAARLSLAVGVPVHVGWTREEDLQHSYYRPPTRTRLRGSVDPGGGIRGVEQHSAGGDIIWSVAGLPEFVRDILGFDPGGLLGQFLPYELGAYRVVNRREQLPIPTGPWRGLGLFANTFALESFVDELANAAQIDPLEFRLRHLPDDEVGIRLRGVLQKAASMASWGQPAAGRGLGIACSLDIGTAVAQVAEVSVSGDAITVEHVWVAVDAGLIINPAGARLQAQGSVVMGLSSTLRESLGVAAGAVTTANFDTYPLLRMADTPPIDVEFIEGSPEPKGMGEPVIGPVAAAVANAVYALTGRRLRELPLAL
ncbi:MAG TPA: molybdopterin cofactor-binding domain-containing protein [Propionibacteriaceae bacterium]